MRSGSHTPQAACEGIVVRVRKWQSVTCLINDVISACRKRNFISTGVFVLTLWKGHGEKGCSPLVIVQVEQCFRVSQVNESNSRIKAASVKAASTRFLWPHGQKNKL